MDLQAAVECVLMLDYSSERNYYMTDRKRGKQIVGLFVLLYILLCYVIVCFNRNNVISGTYTTEENGEYVLEYGESKI